MPRRYFCVKVRVPRGVGVKISDVIIRSVEKVIYKGDFIDTWKYWEIEGDTSSTFFGEETYIRLEETDGGKPLLNPDEYRATPVTKPYFMGWKNGITVMLPSGITTVINILSFYILRKLSVEVYISNIIAWTLSVLFALAASS